MLVAYSWGSDDGCGVDIMRGGTLIESFSAQWWNDVRLWLDEKYPDIQVL